jgi:hypothetical protein
MKKCIVMLIAVLSVLLVSCSNPTDGTSGIDGAPGPMGPPGENAITVYNSLGNEVGTLLAGTYVVTEPDGNVIRIDVDTRSVVSSYIYSDKDPFDDVGAKFAVSSEMIPGHTGYTRYIYNISGRVFKQKSNTILSSYTPASRLSAQSGISSTYSSTVVDPVEVEEVTGSIPPDIAAIINYPRLTF